MEVGRLDWTKLSESGPEARSDAAMAFDTTRKRTVLFGGQSTVVGHLNDTWEFDGENWTQQEDIGPPARRGHCMAYDGPGTRVILFGGLDANDNTLNDTWAWNGSGWVQVAEFGPQPRLNACLAAAGGSLILFGGVSSQRQDADAQVFGDTWEFDGKRWTQRQDIGAGPLLSGGMVFDSGRNRVVLFGGLVEVPGQAAITSGLTWETSTMATAANPANPGNPGDLQLASMSFPAGQIRVDTPTTLKFTLSAAAPVDTTILVGASPSLRTADLSPFPAITIAAGVTSVSMSVLFIQQGQFNLSAGLHRTDEIQVTVNVDSSRTRAQTLQAYE